VITTVAGRGRVVAVVSLTMSVHDETAAAGENDGTASRRPIKHHCRTGGVKREGFAVVASCYAPPMLGLAAALLVIVVLCVPAPLAAQSSGGIAANPGAVDIVAGTGWLGRFLGFDKDSGVRLGGVWVGDAGYLFAGGVEPRTWSFNSLLVLDLTLDLEKLLRIPGAEFGIEFSQFNGQPTNDQAGVVTGYDGLPGPPPLTRSQLNELWWRQRLFDDMLIVRIGKMVPTYDFNNVLRPLPLQDETLYVPALSALMYTPIFKNPTLIGALPGSYNPAYGVTLTFAPTRSFYASYGVYDGNQARGEQTGLNVTPQFNGYYFMIAEAGYGWRVGTHGLPGTAAIGVWRQAGELTGGGVREDGAKGIYAFANQRLWLRHLGVDNSGVSAFFQFGINDSETMIANRYVGFGVTGFGLVPGRPKDSMGGGVAASWLNQSLGFRSSEVILQAYYQMHVFGDIYLQPNITHVPNPGAKPGLSPATAATMMLTVLF
jgi:porin